MIRKSGNRFSEKIMRNKEMRSRSDSVKSHHDLGFSPWHGACSVLRRSIRARHAAFVGVPSMLFALGAASSVLDALQSLAATKSSSSQSATSTQNTTNPFDVP